MIQRRAACSIIRSRPRVFLARKKEEGVYAASCRRCTGKGRPLPTGSARIRGDMVRAHQNAQEVSMCEGHFRILCREHYFTFNLSQQAVFSPLPLSAGRHQTRRCINQRTNERRGASADNELRAARSPPCRIVGDGRLPGPTNELVGMAISLLNEEQRGLGLWKPLCVW